VAQVPNDVLSIVKSQITSVWLCVCVCVCVRACLMRGLCSDLVSMTVSEVAVVNLNYVCESLLIAMYVFLHTSLSSQQFKGTRSSGCIRDGGRDVE